MLAAKLRKATKDDAQELHEFASDSIKNINTDHNEQKVLLEEFSKESIAKWFENEDTKVFVATYMGFIIGCCIWSNKFLTNILVSENYQHQGVASSLWIFARDNAIDSGEISEFKGRVLNRYVKDIKDELSVTTVASSETHTNLMQEPATKQEVVEAKKAIMLWNRNRRYNLYISLALIVFTLLVHSGVFLYIFNPKLALEVVARDAKKDYFSRQSFSQNARENFPKWKIDLLLWRGAEPIYTDDIGECGGAVGIAIMWFQPELLKYLTKDLNSEEKLEILEKCAGLGSGEKLKEVSVVLGE